MKAAKVIDVSSLSVPDMSVPVAQYERVGHPEFYHDQEKVTVVVSNWMNRWWHPWSSGGDAMANFRHVLRAFLLEFSLAFILSIVVSTVASLLGATNIFSGTVLFALSQFLILLILSSVRHSYRLPVTTNTGAWFASWLHSHVGFWIMIAMLIADLGGSALSALFLNATGGAAVPNYAAAFRPVSTAGAYLLSLMAATFINWMHLHNQPMDIHTSRYNLEEETKVVGLNRVNIGTAGAHAAMTLLLNPNGLYTHGNVVMYFGAAIIRGFDVPPGSLFWASELFVSAAGGGLLAWAIHLLSWNVNGLSRKDFEEYAILQEADRKTKKELVSRYISDKSE